MRFGHYTVFDTPEENKHTQVYVEYDVPNNDNLDGATGTMVLSDGSGESSGGGGDSRFSTCEVEVSFTKNGEPLTLEAAGLVAFNECTASPVTIEDDLLLTCYASNAQLSPGHNILTPLLFEGVAYVHDVSGRAGNTYYAMSSQAPVVTGDITLGTFGEIPVVVVRGNGTITFDMVED